LKKTFVVTSVNHHTEYEKYQKL